MNTRFHCRILTSQKSKPKTSNNFFNEISEVHSSPLLVASGALIISFAVVKAVDVHSPISVS